MGSLSSSEAAADPEEAADFLMDEQTPEDRPEDINFQHESTVHFAEEHTWVSVSADELDNRNAVVKNDLAQLSKTQIQITNQMAWLEAVVDPDYEPQKFQKNGVCACMGKRASDWVPAQVKFWFFLSRVYGGKSPLVKEGFPRVSPPHLLPHEGLLSVRLHMGKPEDAGEQIGPTFFRHYDPQTFKGVTGDKNDSSTQWEKAIAYEPKRLMMNRYADSDDDRVQEEWVTLELHHLQFYRHVPSSAPPERVRKPRTAQNQDNAAGAPPAEGEYCSQCAGEGVTNTATTCSACNGTGLSSSATKEANVEDEEVPAGKEPENAVAEEVEFFPDYLSLVEGEGLPEKGLLSADELRKRICYSQGWHVDVTPLPPLAIPLHEYLVKDEIGVSEWEWRKLVHVRGRAAMMSPQEQGEEMVVVPHAVDDTQFALELCICVQPKRLASKVDLGPTIPKRYTRQPIPESLSNQEDCQKSALILFCTDIMDVTEEDVLGHLHISFPRAISISPQPSKGHSKFQSFIVEAIDFRAAAVIKQQMERPDFYEGIRNNHVIYLH